MSIFLVIKSCTYQEENIERDNVNSLPLIPFNNVTHSVIISVILENSPLHISPSFSALYWIDSISL